VSVERFDDYIRTERYFSATLLPYLLLHDNFSGLRAFVDLVESRADSEHDADGTERERGDADFDFSDPEIITEFHIARDLQHYGGDLAGGLEDEDDATPAKLDVPDLVIVLGRELLVAEAKFFSGLSITKLQGQLQSQRKQVRHLFENRPSLRAWLHVALIPDEVDGLDCDVVVTWEDVASLCRSVLGPEHYVTRRFENAVARYPKATGDGGRRNYESLLPLGAVLKLCEREGHAIWVGHDKGEKDLKAKDIAYAEGKLWKWRRAETLGAIEPRHWILGTRFTEIIASLGPTSPLPAACGRIRNYDGILPFDEVAVLCREKGGAIQVGHGGGERAVLSLGLAGARQKKWKWRDSSTNRGNIDPGNWIPGDRFASIAEQLK
jgi:hypothetical protein